MLNHIWLNIEVTGEVLGHILLPIAVFAILIWANSFSILMAR